MIENTNTDLYAEWLTAKETEKKAQDYRRQIEDQLLKELAFPESSEGTTNYEFNNYKMKVVGRINRKINTDLLQDIAKEHGLFDQLNILFNWKADLNKKMWAAADPKITEPLLDAIESKPGRPSISIERLNK